MNSMKDKIKKSLLKAKEWLEGLGFRTGLMVGAVCLICYVISFAQMALPISVGLKGILWVIFFGLAKASQYTALLILGKEGVRRLRRMLKKKEVRDTEVE